jgi:hypothetical protein
LRPDAQPCGFSLQGIYRESVRQVFLTRLPLRPWEDTSILAELDPCLSECIATPLAVGELGGQPDIGTFLAAAS